MHTQHCLASATLEHEPKIAFFVPTKALVEQQYKQFIHYLKPGCRCLAMSGDEVPDLSLKHIVEVNDVLVMTPQILLNALSNNELQSLSVFSLLIFDECHHMKKHYPYNGIMSRYYIDEKLAGSLTSLRLPQVYEDSVLCIRNAISFYVLLHVVFGLIILIEIN